MSYGKGSQDKESTVLKSKEKIVVAHSSQETVVVTCE